MALRFSLREFGRTFATRGRGAELREMILAQRGAERVVVIDFADVTNVSYSFADELVGKLCARASEDIELELVNMARTVDRTVRGAQERRAGRVAC